MERMKQSVSYGKEAGYIYIKFPSPVYRRGNEKKNWYVTCDLTFISKYVIVKEQICVVRRLDNLRMGPIRKRQCSFICHGS